MLSPGGPFPVMCAAFCVAGFGIALQNAQANGFVGGLKNAQTKFSFLHGAYGMYLCDPKSIEVLNECSDRSRSICCTSSCYSPRYSGTVVLSLLDFCWHCNLKYCIGGLGFPHEEPRW